MYNSAVKFILNGICTKYTMQKLQWTQFKHLSYIQCKDSQWYELFIRIAVTEVVPNVDGWSIYLALALIFLRFRFSLKKEKSTLNYTTLLWHKRLLYTDYFGGNRLLDQQGLHPPNCSRNRYIMYGNPVPKKPNSVFLLASSPGHSHVFSVTRRVQCAFFLWAY
jgi:hypothetical protein